jgi:cytochrome c oxidase assembly factor CtaG
LLALGLWYGAGIMKMNRVSPARWRRAAAFAAGWLTLVVALLSPLHAAGEALLSAHMVQHMLLILVAAPLLVASRPLVPSLWAVPPRVRRRSARWAETAQPVWRALTIPAVAFALHNAALFFWHLPGPYNRAVSSETVHAIQHLCFFGTAILFWWGVAYRFGSRQAGSALVYVALTSVITGTIGMVLTFAPRPLYSPYSASDVPGFSPLEDQQLAGLIMWIPGGLGYLFAALALAARWLVQSDRRASRRESAAASWLQSGLSRSLKS